MGQTTTNLQIWSPDSADLNEPDVYLATMTASIENGVGPRLSLQEMAIGLKAGIASGGQIPETEAIAPFVISSVNGNFAQGLTISGGVVTVATAGMYIISASLGVQPKTSPNRTGAVNIYKGSTALGGAEVLQHASFYQTATANCVVNCIAGDTLHVKWHSAGPAPVGSSGNQPIASDLSLTSFSVSMIQAVPQ